MERRPKSRKNGSSIPAGNSISETPPPRAEISVTVRTSSSEGPGRPEGAIKPDFDDRSWRTVNLPHDWAVELDFVNVNDENVRDHGFKPIGRQFPKTTIGWYRRSFTVPKSDEGKRLAVQFDGVFRDCTVWFNGHYLGRNLSGYSEFRYDLSDYIRFGQKNVLAVRVDASQYEGWFYEGAGIYRHIWLWKTPREHPSKRYFRLLRPWPGRRQSEYRDRNINRRGCRKENCLLRRR